MANLPVVPPNPLGAGRTDFGFYFLFSGRQASWDPLFAAKTVQVIAIVGLQALAIDGHGIS